MPNYQNHRRIVTLAACTFFTAACAGDRIPTQAVTENQLARKTVFASQCAIVVRETDGRERVALLAPEAVPFKLPQDARRDTQGRELLAVVSARFLASGGGAPVEIGLACIAPNTLTNEAFAGLIDRHNTLPLLRRKVTAAGYDHGSALPVPIVAANALMKPLTDPLQHKRRTSIRSLGNAAAAPNTAARTASSGPDPYQLPGIIAIGYSNSYLVNMSNLYWFYHRYSSWGAGTAMFTLQEYYDACPNASAKYLADLAEAKKMEDDSAAWQQAASMMLGTNVGTSPDMCVPRNDGKTKCIDLFISSARTFVLGQGDGRDFDSNAPYKASRVQMYLNLDDRTGIAYMNSSSIGWGPATVTANPAPHDPKSFAIHQGENGTVIVEFHFYNGFCQYADRDYCPTIDGFVVFQRGADGRWHHTDVLRDEYPSIQINQQQVDGTFQEEFRDKEGHWTQLLTRANTLKQWRELLNLPPGCQIL
jgi:hypothetical protein